MSSVKPYVGRFAPSPTGPLHLGSLVAALASYLDARANNGLWLLRIEDLDPPRESLTAPGKIIKQLQSFGFHWDGDLLYQSTRLDAYAEALDRLKQSGLVFPCTCSRKAVQGVYSGTCRGRQHVTGPSASRLLTEDREIHFIDLIQGYQSCNLEKDSGDFIVKRKDGLFAYQLAVVVDDEYQGVSHVIRGSDLLDSTPRQIYLAKLLKFRAMTFAHFPVVLGPDGHKLSKQAHAKPVTTENRAEVFNLALQALNQPPVTLSNADKMIQQAIDQWSVDLIPKQAGIFI